MRAKSKILLLLLAFSAVVSLRAQTDSTEDKMRFDLGITRGNNLHLWPIAKVIKSEGYRNTEILFTLYQHKIKRKDTLHHTHLLPVFWYDSTAEYKRLKLLTTYYPSVLAYEKNYRRQYTSFRFIDIAPEISLLNFSKTADGNYLKNSIFFFLWYKQDKINHKSHFVTFPLYWYFASPAGQSSTLFPVFSTGSFHNRANKYTVITPLYWHFNYGGHYQKTMLLPLYFREKQDSGKIFTRTTLFPLYWHYHGSKYRNTVLFPLYWHYVTPYSTTSVLFPLYVNNVQGNKRTQMITPLYWKHQSKYGSTTLLLPFWSRDIRYAKNRFGVPDTFISNYVFPFYFSTVSNHKKNISRKFPPFYFREKTSDVNNLALFPFVFKRDNQRLYALHVLPLFAYGHYKNKDRKFYAVTSLFWRININETYEKGKATTLFPIWFHKKIRDYNNKLISHNVIFPVWWSYRDESSDKTARILFPFVWSFHSPKGRSLAIMPLFSYGQKDNGNKMHYAVTPLFWHIRSYNKRFTMLLPLVWHYKSTRKNFTTVFPLVWYKEKYDNRSLVLFPVWWHYHNNSSDKKVLFPLYWNIRKRNYHTVALMPLFSYGRSLRDSSSKHLAVTPLFWHFKNKYGTKAVLFPVWWYKNTPHYKHNFIAPLWWSRTDKYAKKSKKVLFPLYWKTQSKTDATLTLFPIFSTGRYANGSRYTAITPLFWHIKDKSGSATTLFPVFWHVRKAYKKTDVLFPVYWHFKTPVDTTRVLLPLYISNKTALRKTTVFIPLYMRSKNHLRKSTLSMITPLVWHYHRKDRSSTIFLPLYFRNKNTRYTSTTLFPLFSAGRSSDGKQKHFVFTPLYWNIHRNGVHRVHFAPLFNYRKDSNNTRDLSILYFLYRHHRDSLQKRTSFLWPLCVSERDSSSHAFRFAPVVWVQRSPEMRLTAVMPFVYSKKTAHDNQVNILWQLYTRRSTDSATTKTSALFKAVIANQYPGPDHEYRFLYFVYVKKRLEGKKEITVFPFYQQYSDSAIGYRSKNYCLGMYTKFSKAIPNTTKVYKEEKILWFIRLRSNYKSLKAQGIVVDRKKLRG